jgi:hypothetical protein
MIQFRFNIRNPYSDRFSNLWHTSFSTPFKNKCVELEVYRDSRLVSLSLDITTRQSHAGLDFEIGALGFCFHFQFYDGRHWDHSTDTYQEYAD